jgi:hypothetical protein
VFIEVAEAGGKADQYIGILAIGSLSRSQQRLASILGAPLVPLGLGKLYQNETSRSKRRRTLEVGKCRSAKAVLKGSGAQIESRLITERFVLWLAGHTAKVALASDGRLRSAAASPPDAMKSLQSSISELRAKCLFGVGRALAVLISP